MKLQWCNMMLMFRLWTFRLQTHTHTHSSDLRVCVKLVGPAHKTGGRVRWARPPKQPQGRPWLRHDGKCRETTGAAGLPKYRAESVKLCLHEPLTLRQPCWKYTWRSSRSRPQSFNLPWTESKLFDPGRSFQSVCRVFSQSVRKCHRLTQVLHLNPTWREGERRYLLLLCFTHVHIYSCEIMTKEETCKSTQDVKTTQMRIKTVFSR